MITNQQWVQVKKPSDVLLEGVDIEIDWTDDRTVNSIIIRDAKGNALRIIKSDYSGMRAMVRERNVCICAGETEADNEQPGPHQA